jgi:ribonucleoside-diphosphate reductase alpha chain
MFDINDFEQSAITSIETYGIDNTYDIEVGDVHLFNAKNDLCDFSSVSHNSATIAIFPQDDTLMLNAKTNFKVLRKIGFESHQNKKSENVWEGRVVIDHTYGGIEGYKHDVTLTDYEYNEMLCKDKVINWRHIEPQRARSNNSVLLMRDKVTPAFFRDIIHEIQQYGEPGFVFADDDRFLVNPCSEVGFIPITNDGACGVQFCNLVSMNGKHIDSVHKFKEYAKAATIIGTLQAGYTNFKYLSNDAKRLTEDEALLGVSITGIMENPEILLNPEIQTEVARYTKEVNAKWAKKLGIKPAARITLVKPEGTTSLMLGTSSGIHPHHARKAFRRIQCNKEDNVYKHFKSYNEHATEPSVWSATKTDDVATFPLTVSNKAMVKSDLTAIQHLEYILSTQKHWVLNGETEANHKKIHHNVSCTVIVDDTEWNEVIDFIFLHREFFTGVSFIPKSGDKIYKQAPNEAVITPDDETAFAQLQNNWKRVDYTKMHEADDVTELQKEVACAGGVCEITRL